MCGIALELFILSGQSLILPSSAPTLICTKLLAGDSGSCSALSDTHGYGPGENIQTFKMFKISDEWHMQLNKTRIGNELKDVLSDFCRALPAGCGPAAPPATPHAWATPPPPCCSGASGN
jgi:hypothetical protein